MRSCATTVYFTVAALVLVTVIGVTHTETAKTGNPALAQAMFADEAHVAGHGTTSEQND